jgi:hypothetical protein
MRAIPILCLTIGTALCGTAFQAHATSTMKAEFRTLRQCLQAIEKNSGQRLRVVTDKPTEVSGFLANGQGFACKQRESGTKGTYFEGWFMVDD